MLRATSFLIYFYLWSQSLEIDHSITLAGIPLRLRRKLASLLAHFAPRICMEGSDDGQGNEKL